MVRPYGHRTSSPPSRRLLARRPLDLGLGLRAQTLAADHRDTNSTATVPSSLYCCHRIGVISYDFSDNTHTQVCSAGILNFRHPSVEKIPPWAAPTPLPLALPVPCWTHSCDCDLRRVQRWALRMPPDRMQFVFSWERSLESLDKVDSNHTTAPN